MDIVEVNNKDKFKRIMDVYCQLKEETLNQTKNSTEFPDIDTNNIVIGILFFLFLATQVYKLLRKLKRNKLSSSKQNENEAVQRTASASGISSSLV